MRSIRGAVQKESKHCKLLILTEDEFMSWNDFKPEMIEEQDGVFGPVNGKYKAVLTNFERKKGVSQKGNDYDFIEVKFQVVDNVSGDNAIKRYFDKTFGLTDSTFKNNDGSERVVTADDNMQRFCSMAFTILKKDLALEIKDEDTFETKVGKVIIACEPVIGKIANVTIYPQKDKATKVVKVDNRGNAKHTVLIVAKHKVKGAAKVDTAAAIVDTENF